MDERLVIQGPQKSVVWREAITGYDRQSSRGKTYQIYLKILDNYRLFCDIKYEINENFPQNKTDGIGLMLILANPESEL